MLPIESHLDAITQAMRLTGAVVVEAEPGAGKTTLVPPTLLDAVVPEGLVIVLEPRRLAARLAAERVAELRGEAVGDTVGYQVRFESKRGPKTRLLFVTEGVLVRRLATEPHLPGVAAVVLDEVHERHLQGDLALALLTALRRGPRPDLKLAAMSATLDAAPVAALLDAPHVRSTGRSFPVAIEYAPRRPKDELDVAVAVAVRDLIRRHPDGGHILVFLPGATAIRRAGERCAALARDHDALICPLHGELPRREQDLAVRPSRQRRVILATNVAESSVTIDGVVGVVDSGLSRSLHHRAGARTGQLRERPISRASAEQRAGRAGRTGPGVCVRLYSDSDFQARAAFDEPEIARVELSELTLAAALSGFADLEALPWLTAPPVSSVQDARTTLIALGALEDGGRPTAIGRALFNLPLPPRLARVAVEGARLGLHEEIASAVVVVAERLRAGRSSDLDHHVRAFEDARGAGFNAGVVRRLGLDPHRTRRADRARSQLLRRLEQEHHGRPADTADARHDDFCRAWLSGFGDRVARRVAREARAVGLALAHGGKAEVDEARREFSLVLEARLTDPRRPARVELLLPLPRIDLLYEREDALELVDELSLNKDRVMASSQIRYHGLILEETVAPATPSADTAALLLEAAERRGMLHPEPVLRLRARIDFARQSDASLPPFDDEAVRRAFAQAAETTISLGELEAGAWIDWWLHSWPADAQKTLARFAPAAIELPPVRGKPRRLPVRYPYGAGEQPYVESYLQDFFGLDATPTVGRMPLLLKLWGPNRRPLQTTTDLERFWSEHYPSLFKQLSRRYPKHHWPEEPRTALPVRLKRHLSR